MKSFGTILALVIGFTLLFGSIPWILSEIVTAHKSLHIPSYLDKFERPIILCHRGSKYFIIYYY